MFYRSAIGWRKGQCHAGDRGLRPVWGFGSFPKPERIPQHACDRGLRPVWGSTAACACLRVACARSGDGAPSADERPEAGTRPAPIPRICPLLTMRGSVTFPASFLGVLISKGVSRPEARVAWNRAAGGGPARDDLMSARAHGIRM